jgi:PDZ domain/Peptidase family M28
VGRLGDGKVQVLASGTATEWPHIFMGSSYVTGVESTMVPEALESSDQKSFIDRGIPAVQVFTGPHADYHRPGDTPDKIDGRGLVRVAAFVKEGVAYLAEREEPLTNTIAPTAEGAPASSRGAAPPASGPGRRVSFGTMPDFAFPGPGVRVAGVTPGSPAEKAGVKQGDVLLRFAGQDLANLRAYSDVLKGLEPGQTVTVVIERDGQQKTVETVLAER